MQSKHRYSKQKRTLLAALILLAVVILAAVLIFVMQRLELSRDAAPEGAGTAASRAAQETPIPTEPPVEKTPEPVAETPDEDEDIILYYNGQAYRYNKDLSVLLIMGIDDYDIEITTSSRNQSQSDFLLLAAFDQETRTCKLFQINRDTMVDDPVLGYTGAFIGYNYEQIALSHTYGHGMEDSCQNTVRAVSHFLYETPIDNYFALTMSAIPILNDLVGGVTVTVEDDFTGVDDTLIKGETVTLTSDNVEHYVRSRMSMKDDPTNTNRMKRQRTYLSALMDALAQGAAQDSSFVMDAYFSVSDYLVTDCTVDALYGYTQQLSGYTTTDIVTPEGESVEGEKFMEFYVDEANLQQLIIDTFYTPVDG